jgi:exonuclease SbcD
VKLLHCSDLHLGVTRYGVGDSRLRDIEATLGRIADDAEAHDVAAVLISGDTFDSRRPGPDWLRVFASFVARLRRLIIVPGNHDGMTTIGDPDTHALLWLAALALPNVHVLTEPGVATFEPRLGQEPLDVFALPYPHKRALDSQLADMPVDERATEVGRRVEAAIRELAIRPDPGVPFVFIGHVSTIAAKLGSEAAMKMGWDAMIDPAVLAPFDYAALGHVHRQQQVAPNAWYAGSPEYLDFGDVEAERGWLIVNVEPGQTPVVTVRPNPTRAMVDVVMEQDRTGDWLVDFTALPARNPAAALPMFRVTFHATVERPKPAAIAQTIAWLRAQGASYIKTVVKLDLPVSDNVVQEVDPEADTATLLEGWLREHGHPVEPTLSVGRRLLADLEAAT